jgi:hypothetical protein
MLRKCNEVFSFPQKLLHANDDERDFSGHSFMFSSLHRSADYYKFELTDLYDQCHQKCTKISFNPKFHNLCIAIQQNINL